MRLICCHINIKFLSSYHLIFLCKFDLLKLSLRNFKTLQIFYGSCIFSLCLFDILGEYCEEWSNDKWWCFGRSYSFKPATCNARSLLSTAQDGHRGGYSWLFVDFCIFVNMTQVHHILYNQVLYKYGMKRRRYIRESLNLLCFYFSWMWLG